MTIDSDTNKGGASRGTISRNCENAWSHTVYSAFERLFRAALWGDDLPFRRVGGERAGVHKFSVGRRYGYDSCWDIYMVNGDYNYERDHT
jgi:hypothetical protein